MQSFRIAHLIALLVGLPLLLAACAPATSPSQGGGPASAPAPTAPKNIVVINSGQPAGMDNRFVITTNNAAGIVLWLYSGVMIAADNGATNYMARLAEQVPSLENGLWKLNPDSTMETRLTLAPGARWHDGAPLTTHDLIFNDEVFREKTIPQIYINQRSYPTVRNYIDRMEAVDDRTLVIHWNRPYI